MSTEMPDPLGGAAPHTSSLRWHLSAVAIGWMVLLLLAFSIWVWATFASTTATASPSVSPVAEGAAIAMWALMVLGFCGLLAMGTLLIVRPDLYARFVWRPEGLSRRHGVRRWLKLGGLAIIWAGLWAGGFMLVGLIQAVRMPAQFGFSWFGSLTLLYVIYGVAAVPSVALMLAGLLVPLP